MMGFDPATQAELNAEAAARAAGDVKLSGDTVQVVNTQTGAVSTTTTVMPFDDTIPQITFRVRAGQHTAGTLTMNGDGGARRLGGILFSSITITEYKA